MIPPQKVFLKNLFLMKKIPEIISFIFLLSLFSCEEVIEIDLNESNAQWVIEANIDDQNNQAQVSISQTGSYFNPGPISPGTGANITLNSSDGNFYDLTEYEPGKYASTDIDLQVLQQYDLSVELEGKTYEAISVLQAPVNIDSLSSEFRSGAFGFGEGYYLRLEFQDPPGVRNYLRFEIIVNGTLRSDIALYDDNLTDGNRVSFPLFVEPFELGDIVEVKAYSMDFDQYRYWTGLSEILGFGNGGGESAAPANPPSNFSNDALGYFGVSSVSLVTKEVK